MAQRIYAVLLAALGWFAIIGQYVVSTTTIFNYVSFFTILSNILVTLTATFAALAPDSRPGRLLLKPIVATSTALYITITGVIYYVLLAKLYDLVGWNKTFSETLHYVMPPAYVLFWLLFIPKGTLTLRHVPWMLLFPLAYGIYTLLRGPLVDWYPYPFIDVRELGYPRAFRNIGEFVIFFALMGSIYVLIDQVVGRLRRR